MWYFCIILPLSFFVRASSMRILCAASSRSRSFCLVAGSFKLSRERSRSIALARFLMALRPSFSTAGVFGRALYTLGVWPVLSRFLSGFSWS